MPKKTHPLDDAFDIDPGLNPGGPVLTGEDPVETMEVLRTLRESIESFGADRLVDRSPDDHSRENVPGEEVHPGIDREIPDLDDIIRESRGLYNNIVGDIPYADPRHKAGMYGLADKFLTTMKDAIYKKEQILLKRTAKEAKKGTGTGSEEPASVEEPEAALDTYTRNDVYSILEARKKKLNG